MQLLSSSNAELARNVAYLSTIIDLVIITMCSCELPFRGHNEGIESNNRGNFHELFQFTQRHAPSLQQQMGGNAQYTSHTTTDAIITLLFDVVMEAIRSEMGTGKPYAILADETKSVAKREMVW